jgi:transcriptional regulator with XRE-family HTH domain
MLKSGRITIPLKPPRQGPCSKNTTNKWLDKYLATCYAKQDKEIAGKLRVRQSTVSIWRSGRAHPDAESIEKMTNAIGEPVGPWLAQIEAERARTPANRQVWLRLAATLGTALAIAITALPATVTASAGTLPIV